MRGVVVYEVFPRNHGDGTLRGLVGDLPRIVALGVGVLWLMPIHPIGVMHRKGTLGSPYSVRDYHAVDPALGTTDDLKALVRAAHEKGLRVVLDWVPNHVAWDHALVAAEPSWVLRGADGAPRPPVPEWSDVVGLDYREAALRRYMISALTYWVREADVDGYRCDVAGMVPDPFWREARAALEQVKPGVFLLAEAEGARHHAGAFDATYDWTFYARLCEVRRGRLEAEALARILTHETGVYPEGSGRLRFVENHDTPRACRLFGEPFTRAALALLFLAGGLPLVYAGLESTLLEHTSLFEPDPVPVRACEMARWIETLARLRGRYAVLHAGTLRALPTRHPREICAFRREDSGTRLACAVNLSPRAVPFALRIPVGARAVCVRTGRRVRLEGRKGEETIAPFDYLMWDLGA